MTFDVMVHLGTLIGVVAALWDEVALRFTGLQPVGEVLVQNGSAGRRLIFLLIIGTLPAGIVGFLARDFIEQLFSSISVVGAALLVTEAFVVGGRLSRRQQDHGQDEAQRCTAYRHLADPGPGAGHFRSGTTIMPAFPGSSPWRMQLGFPFSFQCR